MPTNGNCCPTTGLPTPAVPGPALPDSVFNPCETATYVKICSDTAPITVTGADCAGAPLTVTNANVVLTVPAPGAVQLVKFCAPTGELDREYSTLCAPDGTKVLVVAAWDKTAPLTTAPAIEAYTLAGAPYTGDRALLTDCAAEKLDVVSEDYCVAGVQYERVSFYDVTATPPTLSATLWRNGLGAVVSNPGEGKVGACLPSVHTDRDICVNTTAGEVWNVLERTSTNTTGVVATSYWDPDTSPMLDVTTLFASIRHGGACDCCNDKPCIFEDYHENLSPIATLMAVYGTNNIDTLGFVNPFTGQLVTAGTVPGANLNALGLDKSTNNAVFIDRDTGNIYAAYSPSYTITATSTLQPGPVDFGQAIMGALDGQQQWWVGSVSDIEVATATINVAKVNPITGVQTAVPSLTAILNSGAYGFDLDFSPSDDLYALVGLNIYVSTKVTNYAGWASVGLLTGIGGTAGSLAYDVGILRGVSDTGQLWAYDLATGLTTITATIPEGIRFADMAGAVDPVCKRVYRNSCTGVFYELDKTTVYTPIAAPIPGVCA